MTDELVRTNVFSMFFLAKAALPHMAEGSAIVNCTSVTAYRGHTQLLDYSATKGAIVTLTRSLSQLLAPRGIRVNAVAPGPIWTPLIPASFDAENVSSHLSETETHVRRLEQVFELLDQKASAKPCEALEGLIREAEEVMGEIADEQTLDAAIISSAQTVEHYEIARYGTLACWAAEIDNSEVVELLEQTLEEEKAADEKLSEIAEDAVNQRAAA